MSGFPRDEQNRSISWLLKRVRHWDMLLARLISGGQIRLDPGGGTTVGPVPTMQADLEIRIPLANPIIASNVTQLEDWIHKKPYNVGHRINKLYARAASAVGGDVTFKLQKNGVDIAGAVITIPSGARVPTSGTPVSFTEADLADGDVITAVQTTARTDAINISLYVYGDRDAPAAVA